MEGSRVLLTSNPAMVGVGQPLINQAVPKRKRACSDAVFAFSIINIVLCIISAVLMTAIIVPFSGNFNFSGYGYLDVVGHGLWAGIFYLITGLMGYSASYKESKCLWVSTLVFAVFSAVVAIPAAVLSGIMTGDIYYSRPCQTYCDNNYYYCFDYYVCNVWTNLEFTLMGFSILAFVNNIAVTACVGAILCKRNWKKPQSDLYTVFPGGNPMVQGPYGNAAWSSNQYLQQPMQVVYTPQQAMQQPIPMTHLPLFHQTPAQQPLQQQPKTDVTPEQQVQSESVPALNQQPVQQQMGHQENVRVMHVDEQQKETAINETKAV